MGEGGEIFILEMGEPISIVSLARDLIKLSGFTPDVDIMIDFSGMRPGEKLYEEINLGEENATKTKHPRIWIGKSQTVDLKQFGRQVDELLQRVPESEPDGLRAAIGKCVPEYQPQKKSEDKGAGSVREPAASEVLDEPVGDVTM